MSTARQKCIVISLRRSPAMQEAIQAAQADCRRQNARHANLRRSDSSGSNCKSRVSCNGIARDRIVDVATNAAEADAKSISQRRTENVSLLYAGHLPAGRNLLDAVLQRFPLRFMPTM